MIFLGDIGGYMGLLLGASALTVAEVLDLIFYNGVRKIWKKNKELSLEDDEEQGESGKHSYNFDQGSNGGLDGVR